MGTLVSWGGNCSYTYLLLVINFEHLIYVSKYDCCDCRVLCISFMSLLLKETSTPFSLFRGNRPQLLWEIREVFDWAGSKWQLRTVKFLFKSVKHSNIHITNESSKNRLSPSMKSQPIMLIIKGSVTSIASFMVMVCSWVYFCTTLELMENDCVSRAAAVQEQMHYHVFHPWASAAALHLQTAFSVQLHHRLCVTRSDKEAAKVVLFWVICFSCQLSRLFPYLYH